jgi:NFU1 iron-sulfur cluster scaffold homolog, mitochondrial
VIASGSRSYPDVESAQADVTASRLFEIPHVASVFYVGNTVTVNKDEDGRWEEMITPIADILEETLVPASAAPAEETAYDPYAAGASIQRPEDFFQLSLEVQMGHINRILDEMVRPGLAGDGGGLDLLGIDGSTVRIHYEGACGSCPSSTAGTLSFIEGALQRKAHPELSVVTA